MRRLTSVKAALCCQNYLPVEHGSGSPDELGGTAAGAVPGLKSLTYAVDERRGLQDQFTMCQRGGTEDYYHSSVSESIKTS